MTVSQEEVPKAQAKEALTQTAGLEFRGINDAVIQFIKVKAYTTFDAEYAWIDNDLVIHFFMPPEFVNAPRDVALKWWTETFSACLESAARQFFSADYPRLVAKYTEEMTSWWFRAHGYGDVLDPDAFAVRFLKQLDATIERAQTQAG